MSSGDIDIFSTLSVAAGIGIDPRSPSVENAASADIFVLSAFKFAVDAIAGRIASDSVSCASRYSPRRFHVCSKQGDYGDINGPMFSRARAKLRNQQVFGG